MKKSDLRCLSYAEFGVLLDELTRSVSAFARERPFSAVAPILRSGATPATHLASKLGIVRLIPVQYKHAEGGRVARLLEPASAPALALDTSARILLVDTNTVTGAIATAAASDLKRRYPGATIHLATVVKDASVSSLPQIESVFFASLSNEAETLERDEAKARGISDEVWVFPWEDLDEQWEEIQRG